MSSESPPKRESYTGWIIGVGVLLLLAAGIPLVIRHLGPRDLVLRLESEAGTVVKWSCDDLDGPKQMGVTNLPATFKFHARRLDFAAMPTNLVTFMRIELTRDGQVLGNVVQGGSNGVRFYYDTSEWGLRPPP
jgi:hypothetical protein